MTMRPDVVFPRRDLTVVSRRPPTEAEAASLGPGMIVVECQLGEDSGEATSSSSRWAKSALTGLLSWLEAAPPSSPIWAQPVSNFGAVRATARPTPDPPASQHVLVAVLAVWDRMNSRLRVVQVPAVSGSTSRRAADRHQALRSACAGSLSRRVQRRPLVLLVQEAAQRGAREVVGVVLAFEVADVGLVDPQPAGRAVARR